MSGEAPDHRHEGAWNNHMARQKYWGSEYDERARRGEMNEKDKYHRLARQHLARQPSIQDDLLDALRANVCTSYRALSRYINGWCTTSTIEHWLKQHEDYHLYSKNIKPGLTPENKVKQVPFATHVHNLWGLPRDTGRKILWVMCDEKWFHALVPRTNAKACASLGLHKSTYSAHHKSHIGKVMVHCTVGYLFADDPELGGEGFLIGCNRCAGFKVPSRDIRIGTRDPLTKKLTYKGNPIKHPKGIPFLVDCNVTGTNPGTPTNPCFPLKTLWEHCLIPSLEKLTAPGGPCEGALVILQEDNAGPHTEGNYHAWMTAAFAALLSYKLPKVNPFLFFSTSQFLYLLLSLSSLKVLIAMFWTSAFSRQCPTDTVHTCSCTIILRQVWTKYGRLSLTFGAKRLLPK